MWYWWVGEEKKSCAGKSQRHSLQNVRTWIQKVIMVGMINVGLAQMKKRKTISCRVTLQIARHGGSPCPKLIDFRWCGSARNACKSGYFRFCFEYRWSSAPRFFPDGDQGDCEQAKDKHGCFHSKLISSEGTRAAANWECMYLNPSTVDVKVPPILVNCLMIFVL